MNFPYKSTSYFILLSLLVPRILGCPDLSVFLRKKTMVVSVPAQSHRDGGEESQAHCPPMGIGCGSLLPLTLPEGEEINRMGCCLRSR